MSSKHNDSSGARILLLGLDEELGSELKNVLAAQDQAVFSEAFVSGRAALGTIDRLAADLVFCPADGGRYMELLKSVVHHRPELPVVVVSRTPEVTQWLDAMEAGASDYCAAPFESAHIRWILDSNLKRQPAPARYRTAAH